MRQAGIVRDLFAETVDEGKFTGILETESLNVGEAGIVAGEITTDALVVTPEQISPVHLYENLRWKNKNLKIIIHLFEQIVTQLNCLNAIFKNDKVCARPYNGKAALLHNDQRLALPYGQTIILACIIAQVSILLASYQCSRPNFWQQYLLHINPASGIMLSCWRDKLAD